MFGLTPIEENLNKIDNKIAWENDRLDYAVLAGREYLSSFLHQLSAPIRVRLISSKVS